ncbi:hypothetical protein DSO57_1019191 [Entomophthora muscae]|uniref:Uncharacterized protein n=1 Tax=Entomophthora muscae TaxID=34485 RepID=A0ACC2SGT6_9FUNG|nr:hypothetical protein DSO57_1019191 [Entomophthora muscae]
MQYFHFLFSFIVVKAGLVPSAERAISADIADATVTISATADVTDALASLTSDAGHRIKASTNDMTGEYYNFWCSQSC